MDRYWLCPGYEGKSGLIDQGCLQLAWHGEGWHTCSGLSDSRDFWNLGAIRVLYVPLELLNGIQGFAAVRTLQRVLRGLTDWLSSELIPFPRTLSRGIRNGWFPSSQHEVSALQSTWHHVLTSVCYLCSSGQFCDCFYSPSWKYCFKLECQLVLYYVFCPKLCFSVQLPWPLSLWKWYKCSHFKIEPELPCQRESLAGLAPQPSEGSNRTM